MGYQSETSIFLSFEDLYPKPGPEMGFQLQNPGFYIPDPALAEIRILGDLFYTEFTQSWYCSVRYQGPARESPFHSNFRSFRCRPNCGELEKFLAVSKA